jgi:hypothetical protein
MVVSARPDEFFWELSQSAIAGWLRQRTPNVNIRNAHDSRTLA